VSLELPQVPIGLAAAPAGAGLHQHIDPATPRWLLPLARALVLVNRGVMLLGMVALLASALILTSSVVTRYLLHASTDWQDEASVFCLVGATFLCSAFVQAIRGHVGIEAVSSLLPERVNRVRIALVDLGCLAFCAFFAWKSCHAARDVLGHADRVRAGRGRVVFMAIFMPASSLDTVTQNVYEEMASSRCCRSRCSS
jgi:TRAP-type C4-dicarboxylate transport system permease small subunit